MSLELGSSSDAAEIAARGCCPFCGTASSSASSSAGLVRRLRANGVVTDAAVARAFLDVPRERYLRTSARVAYLDAALDIGFNVQISAPHVHAIALGALADRLAGAALVLDVGSGTGWLAAAMASMAPRAIVHGREHVPELAARSRESVASANPALAPRVALRACDGVAGWDGAARYDVIHCGCALPALLPALLRQLKPGGRMVLPLGEPGERQWLTVVDKPAEGEGGGEGGGGGGTPPPATRRLLGVLYVPYTSLEQQLRSPSFASADAPRHPVALGAPRHVAALLLGSWAAARACERVAAEHAPALAALAGLGSLALCCAQSLLARSVAAACRCGEADTDEQQAAGPSSVDSLALQRGRRRRGERRR
jgi:protein-L-isoaspartate(D-aspartate) O-methyltransferase